MVQARRRRGRRRGPLAAVDAEPFRLAFEHSPVGIAIGHPTSGVIYVNPAMCRLLATAPGDVQVETFFAVTERDEEPAARARMNAVVRGELDSYDAEKRFSHPDGSEVWVRWHVVANRDLDGTLSSLVAHAEDITERRQAETALRDSRDRFRAACDLSLDSIVLFTSVRDEEGQIVDFAYADANPNAERLTGHRREELLGRRLSELFPSVLETGALERYIHVVEASKPLEGEFRVQGRGIAATWLREQVVPLGDGLAITSRNVSQRKEAELALRASDERFRALMRHSTDVVIITTPAGTVGYVSPAVEAVLGYSPEEFGAQDPVHLVHADDRAIWREQWAHVADGSETPVNLELRALHADGRYRWFDVTLRNLADDPAVGGIMTHFHDVTDRHQAEQDLVHQTLHDALTSLPNRALLLDRLGHALDRTERSEGPGVAVLFVDLDHFKEVNDSLGHAAGDALLVEVGSRLRSTVRPADTVARLAGDEFVICCEDVMSGTEAIAMAERVLEALRHPFSPVGRIVHLGASVGIALAGRPTDTPETLLRDSDTAMYFAKGHGRDRFEIYDDGIRTRLLQRIQVETDLEAALDADELRLHYQPVFSLDSDEIVAVEALLRWEHPERGLVLPDDFLGVAERAGLSWRIGDRVLAMACAQAEAWRAGDYAPATTWVNLSAHQVLRPGLVERIATLLGRHGLPGASLGLELSEVDLMEVDRTPGAAHVLTDLAALGCRVAIDNFGTGYSSLRYVDRYSVDTLKIDRSLVDGIAAAGEASIVSAIVAVGRLLSVNVAAAGVETPEQLVCLRAAGCTVASGFLLAGPAPASALAGLLRGRAAS